jgi:cation diffusion facilitator family transporter
LLSLVVGSALLAIKYFAYRLTGSTAILSDALESIVNVVAALFALGGLRMAAWPADRNHPYGHGKIEYLSAAFEGGLISFAAVLIVIEAARAFAFGSEIEALDWGICLTLAAGLVNAGLGWYLVRTGERTQSITLIADGKHVLTDFWTSIGVVVGLGLVHVTGLTWLDPTIATVVALNLAYTGWKLVREAAGGLLDEEDRELLRELVESINGQEIHGVIRVHFLRAIRAGSFRHVDAHLVVPEFWPVDRAHAIADELEQRVIDALPGETEIAFHVDPCHREFCSVCDVEPCPIRAAPFERREPITLEEAIQPDPPMR